MSMSTALSGLNAAESALQTISNNLANMNTDGYKSQSTTFADLSTKPTATVEVVTLFRRVLVCR